jgi:hypothetical protein
MVCFMDISVDTLHDGDDDDDDDIVGLVNVVGAVIRYGLHGLLIESR